MKYDVFISYSSKDQKVVEAMCAYLEQHKIRCFVAYRDVPKGVVWAKAIVEALDESAMMVVVFSEDFNLSDQVDREIEIASEDKKPILTFRISDAIFTGAKKYYLKNINWIDAFPHPEQVFDSLRDNVCKLSGKSFVTEQSVKPVVPVTPAPAPPKPMERTWKVGDYYDVGGKQGVVFWVDKTGKHGKIVSLDEADLQWCTDDEYKNGLIFIAESEYSGMKNMRSIQKISDWRSKYPAFAWCADHGKGWYLPAIEELKALMLDDNVHDAVNAEIEILGGKKMFSRDDWEYYWSSTEYNKRCAWNVRLSIGLTSYYDRSYNFCVRAVSAF